MVKNCAFVFIKPHAVTDKVKDLVKAELERRGLAIRKEGSITGKEIDQRMLIDKHYYAIAAKATLKKPTELNIPKEKFKDFFNVEWDKAVKEGKVFNAKDACEKLGVDAEKLDSLWAAAKKDKKLVKFGGGFYCGLIEGLYVFNGFFMSMRSKFVTEDASIYYYVVEWDAKSLPWEDFRAKVLGPTDPADAPKDSIRGMVAAQWKELGLKEACNTGDNAVHASASPFESLAERLNWLNIDIGRDAFAKHLFKAGVNKKMIKEWAVDPQVTFGEYPITKSLFDALEDTDADYCLALCQMIGAFQGEKKDESAKPTPLELEYAALKERLAKLQDLAHCVEKIQTFGKPEPKAKEKKEEKQEEKTSKKDERKADKKEKEKEEKEAKKPEEPPREKDVCQMAMCSIHPYMTILDKEKAKPIMEEFVAKTKTEKGCIYYGWDIDGDKLFCREAYVNATAVLKHLENVGPCLDALLAGPAKLDRLEFHGPASELSKLKETATKLNAHMYTVDMGLSFMVEENASGEPRNFGLCTVNPYFTVLNMDKAKPIMQDFVERTAKEKSCVFYGWTMEGDKLFCREGYLNANGVLRHLENVGPCIDKLLEEGVCKLDSIEFHGPQADLEKLEEKVKALNAKCFATDSGFQRFKQTPRKAPKTLGSTGSMVSVHPYFTVVDMGATKPLMEEFITKTKTEKNCLYYGWDLDGSNLFCREAYLNASAVLEHLENVGPLLDKILAGPAKLDRLEFHGPASELAKLKATAEKLSAKLFVSDKGISFIKREDSGSGGEQPSGFFESAEGPQNLVTIHPYFTVSDLDKAKPIMSEFVERTKKERGCIYYGWTMDDNKLFCREAYLDGDAVLKHLDNVGSCIGALLADGIASLDSIAFHGPKAELDKLSEKAKALNAKLYVNDSGFQKCVRI
eukprot:TRINITY_DN2157_c1_g1_i1.p1 TRINITY_DN2157_c1_g1~~TRINITY_DN2157_c1_g1_i1.p1  ORF type:complete len:912 (-),score=368.51 TRINITY_DN2157_c1_g1_i1:215-2950(-)